MVIPYTEYIAKQTEIKICTLLSTADNAGHYYNDKIYINVKYDIPNKNYPSSLRSTLKRFCLMADRSPYSNMGFDCSPYSEVSHSLWLHSLCTCLIIKILLC